MKTRVGKKILEMVSAGLLVTKHDVAFKAPCDLRTAWAALNRLNDARLIYISRWKRFEHGYIPVYKLGDKYNQSKPAPLTRTQINKKRLSNPEYMIREMMRKRLKRLIAKHEQQPSNKSLSRMDI